MGEHTKLLETAVQAAVAGAEVISAARRSGVSVRYSAKGQNDFVTAVDKEAEAAIVGVLRSRHPDHGILAEESPATDAGGAYRWIIDPLDGTTNFIHGFPIFSVSVAVARSRPGPPRGADVVAGAILDVVRKELFTAERGGGAFRDGEPMRVSGNDSLDACLLLTGFPFRAQHLLEKYLRVFADLHRATQGLRRPGSAALDLAYTACGRADGFFELSLSAWDMAAGSLMVEEAGGVVRDFEGGGEHLATGNIVAGTAGAVAGMLDVIARHMR